MTDREKLIELLKENCHFGQKCPGECTGCMADHLIANGVTVQKWISVKDRLPENGAIVLCNTDYFVEVLQWDQRSGVWVGDCRIYNQNRVTHWMPLPEPPKEGEA